MKKLPYPPALLEFSHDIMGRIKTIVNQMLLNPNHRKKFNIIWGIFAVLIIISMVMLYVPALYR